MKYILTIQEREIFSYIDSIILLNESNDNILDKCKNVLNKIKNLSTSSKRKILIYFISSLLTIASVDKIIDTFNVINDPVAKEIVDEKFKFKNPLHMKTSVKGLHHIKSEEGKPGTNGEPVLKAYALGDGKITVGWGHAEKPSLSKLKPGQKINLKRAEYLFKKDIKLMENSVKNIFREWESKNIHVKITQDQFDALVSIAFNMGPTGLRRAEFMQNIKNGQLKQAGKKIISTNISQNFPGLEKRRMKESKMFLSYLGDRT